MRAFDRQALHAAHLGFEHPVTGEPLAFTTPIPPDMAKLQSIMEDTVAMRAKGI
jgi:23S rRNA pseudouridine1911/1915/1917 synthase